MCFCGSAVARAWPPKDEEERGSGEEFEVASYRGDERERREMEKESEIGSVRKREGRSKEKVYVRSQKSEQKHGNESLWMKRLSSMLDLSLSHCLLCNSLIAHFLYFFSIC